MSIKTKIMDALESTGKRVFSYSELAKVINESRGYPDAGIRLDFYSLALYREGYLTKPGREKRHVRNVGYGKWKLFTEKDYIAIEEIIKRYDHMKYELSCQYLDKGWYGIEAFDGEKGLYNLIATVELTHRRTSVYDILVTIATKYYWTTNQTFTKLRIVKSNIPHFEI